MVRDVSSVTHKHALQQRRCIKYKVEICLACQGYQTLRNSMYRHISGISQMLSDTMMIHHPTFRFPQSGLMITQHNVRDVHRIMLTDVCIVTNHAYTYAHRILHRCPQNASTKDVSSRVNLKTNT